MKIMIVNERDNPHMGRKEVDATVEHVAGSTPSRAGLQQFFAKQFSLDARQVDIKKIFSSTGRQQSRITVFVWNDMRVEDLSKPKEEKKGEQAGTESN